MQASSPQLPTTTWQWQVNDTAKAAISETGVLLAKRAGTVVAQACAMAHAVCGNAVIMIAEVVAGTP